MQNDDVMQKRFSTIPTTLRTSPPGDASVFQHGLGPVGIPEIMP